MLTLVFKQHSNTRTNRTTRSQKQALKFMLELGEFQLPNQITAWQLDVVLGHALAVLSKEIDEAPLSCGTHCEEGGRCLHLQQVCRESNNVFQLSILDLLSNTSLKTFS